MRLKMRRVPCKFLRPGLKLANHVYSHDGRVLLAKDVVLTNAYIKGLLRKGIPFIYIDDEISKEIYISDVVSEETRNQANKYVKNAFKNAYSKLINSDTINLKEIRYSISEIIDQLLSNKNLIYDLIDIRSVDDYLFGHSVNVCILSLMTGLALNYNRNQLEQLAVGAMFHDIGKALVPARILNKPGKLNNTEFEEIKKHPEYSLNILRKNSSVDSVSRMIAYQHHEKFNGEGYPLQKKGNEILDMSQIVGIVDIYDAITSNRCYSKAVPSNEAYEMLSGAGDHYFKFDIVKAFLSQIAAYPSGSLVQLSTGETAIVDKNYKNQPNTPKVRVLLEPDGSILKQNKELDLSKNNMAVIRLLNEEEVQQVQLHIKKFK